MPNAAVTAGQLGRQLPDRVSDQLVLPKCQQRDDRDVSVQLGSTAHRLSDGQAVTLIVITTRSTAHLHVRAWGAYLQAAVVSAVSLTGRRTVRSPKSATRSRRPPSAST